MQITEYGKIVREMRDKADVSLRNMAQGIGYSPTFLSAVEIGEKRLTDELVDEVITYLRRTNKFSSKELNHLRAAGDRTRREVDVSRLNRTGREAVAAFARRWADLDRQTREDFLRRLEVSDEGK